MENDIKIEKYTPKSWGKSCLLGFFIGLAVIVPGISGSTIAIIFKLYDKLIYAISNIFKKFVICFLFLIPIILGALIGVGTGFFTIKYLIDLIPFAIVSLFAGLMAGSIPSIKDEIKNDKVNLFKIILLIIGIIIPIIISVISTLLLNNNSSTFNDVKWYEYIICLCLGFVVAITQLVPGLSATAFLMSVGYFNKIINIISISAIKEHPEYLGILGSLLLGFIIGLIAISKLISYIFNKNRITTFYLIFGFVIGSIFSMFFNPDIYETYLLWSKNEGNIILELSLGIPLFFIGIILSYLFVRYERNKNNNINKLEENNIN